MSKVLGAFFALTAFLWAGLPQVRGIVKSTQNNPLEHVIILNLNNGDWTLTDEWGAFQIPLHGFADSLIIRRYGYRADTLLIEANGFIAVTLNPTPVKMDTLKVQPYSRDSQASFFQDPGTANLPTIVHQIPALTLRTYGGIGGLATFSLEGGPATHTKVLFEGIDLTSSQNGETDLSQIPTFLLESLTFSRTPALAHGSGAVDGALTIRLPSTGNLAQITTGSFGYKAAAAHLRLPIKSWPTDLSIGRVRNGGNFPVTNREVSNARQNNDFEQFFWMGRIKRLIKESLFISAIMLDSRQNRGIPGLVFSPTPDSRRKDHLNLAGINSGWLWNSHAFFASLTRRFSTETYVNPLFAINSQHDVEDYKFRGRWQWEPRQTLVLKSGFQLDRESITSTDAGTHERTFSSFSFHSNLEPYHHLNLFMGLRFDRGPNHLSEQTWQTRLEWNGTGNTMFTLAGGRAFRTPTFNDLYWVPGGNPGLKSEFTHYGRLEISQTFRSNQYWSLRYSMKSSRDLIQWVPIETIWKPINVASSRRETVTVESRGEIMFFHYQGHLSYLNTRDLKEQKPLRYSPNLLGTFRGWIEGKSWDGALQITYTGERITMYSWPKDVTLPAYALVSLELGMHIPRLKGLRANAIMENIFDRNYMTINGYPEPGRNLRVSLTYEK